jgi:hypothetical protein
VSFELSLALGVFVNSMENKGDLLDYFFMREAFMAAG